MILNNMIIFKMRADLEFEADNIDDAFKKLSEHFKNAEESQLIEGGYIEINAINKKGEIDI